MAQRRIEDIKPKRGWNISLVLIIAILFTNIPIIWVILTSLKASTEITSLEPLWIFGLLSNTM